MFAKISKGRLESMLGSDAPKKEKAKARLFSFGRMQRVRLACFGAGCRANAVQAGAKRPRKKKAEAAAGEPEGPPALSSGPPDGSSAGENVD